MQMYLKAYAYTCFFVNVYMHAGLQRQIHLFGLMFIYLVPTP